MNKLKRVVSAALFCASLLLLAGVTGCSKDVVNEEVPVAKGMQGNPPGPGGDYCPTFDYHVGIGLERYYSMDNKKCMFKTNNPNGKRGMKITVSTVPGSKRFYCTIRTIASLAAPEKLIASELVRTEESNFTMMVTVPDGAFIPTETVLVTIESATTDGVGIAYTYF